MLFYTGLIILVIAVSLDGFGVGVTYGARNILVPPLALLIIMFCSGVIVLLSMTIGNLLSAFISPHLASVFGGAILVALGIFSLINIIRPKLNAEKLKLRSHESNHILHQIKTVLSTPDHADVDRSGVISEKEAVVLGSALALDAFGAGLGASMLGYSPILTSILIAFMSGLFVFGGIKTGLLISRIKQLQHLTFLPPLLLITIGIFNMM